MTTETTPRPTDRPLVWDTSNDPKGNTTHEAVSHARPYTDGYAEHWDVHPVLEHNAVAWTIECSTFDLLPAEEFTERYPSAEAARARCQQIENDLRAFNGMTEDNATAPAPAESPAPPMVDEHGFSPTRMVRPRWSRNGGILRIYRVWRKVDAPELEQEREIFDDEYNAALKGFAESKLLDAIVRNIDSKGAYQQVVEFGPKNFHFAMAIELHFVRPTAFWREVDGKTVDRYEPPTADEVLRQIRIRNNHTVAALEIKAGEKSEAELRAMIEETAAEVGIDTSSIIPVELENLKSEHIPIDCSTLRTS